MSDFSLRRINYGIEKTSEQPFDENKENESTTEQSHACIAFEFEDPKEAYEHMQCKVIKDYGKMAYGHALHTWDDGHRVLLKCQRCGGYILLQASEYHSFSDSGDDYYRDWFPVSSPEEAEELNKKYSGHAIEEKFEERYLMRTNDDLFWSWR